LINARVLSNTGNLWEIVCTHDFQIKILERPEDRARVEKALTAVCGSEQRVKFYTAEDLAKRSNPIEQETASIVAKQSTSDADLIYDTAVALVGVAQVTVYAADKQEGKSDVQR
jgi:hypothetical protein